MAVFINRALQSPSSGEVLYNWSEPETSQDWNLRIALRPVVVGKSLRV